MTTEQSEFPSMVTVELSNLDEDGKVPSDYEGDAHVYWQGEDRLIKIQETRPKNSHPGYRYFSINGGFPIDWLEDELADAIASELGRRMMSVVKFI